MAKQSGALRRFWLDEAGATVAEYLLMTCLIGVAALTAVAFLGHALGPLYQSATNGLS